LRGYQVSDNLSSSRETKRRLQSESRPISSYTSSFMGWYLI